jgi:transcriptional regulator with GAF, ATPase, and Fis domain
MSGIHPDAKPKECRTLVASSSAAFRKEVIAVQHTLPEHVDEALSGAHALAKMEASIYETLILDRHLPDLNVPELAELVCHRFPEVNVIIRDSLNENSLPTLPTGFSSPVLPLSVEPDAGEPLRGMLGRGCAMQYVYRLTRLVASRNTTVLITGETGTGKELIARGIHELSQRATKPFVVVNCAAIPENLLEAELFGHERGAFTGAVQTRVGRIHSAHGGTLFLDEIGDLPLMMQAKLLRFLQDGEVQRLGSSDLFRVDVRVVCATNVNLLDHVRRKLFRQDLFYRVAVFPVELPPLRDRGDDIELLAKKFLADLCREAAVPKKNLSASSVAFLRQSKWPGNVRELQHSVERAFILAGREIQVHVEHFSSTPERSWS